MKPDKIKKLIMMIIPAAVLVALSAYLLQGDVWTFWTWYLLALVLGSLALGGLVFALLRTGVLALTPSSPAAIDRKTVSTF